MPDSTQKTRSRLAWPAAIVLALGAFVLYLPALNGQFVFDDPAYVQFNPHLRPLSIEVVRWAVTQSHQANWHPLTWLSHAVDLALFGDRPAGHHVVSLAIHAINSALLLLLLMRLTGRLGCSFAVAAFFAVHPLQVESVAWISERKTLLCTAFTLLCLHLYVSYVHRPGALRYVAAMIALAAALMSKQMAVTVPFLLLLLDYWPLRRFRPHVLLEKVPLVLLSVGASWMAWSTQRGAGAVTPVRIIGWDLRLPNMVLSIARYVGKLVVPVRLSPFYPYPGMEAPAWPIGVTLACAALLGVLCLLAVALARRAPVFLVGWSWFLGMLVPVLGIVQIGRQSMADRYMYLPCVGLLMAVVWSVDRLVRRACATPDRPGESDDLDRSAGVAGAIPYGRASILLILLGACCYLTQRQIGVWHSSETFWRHVLNYAPDSANARYGLARALGRLSPGEAQDAYFDEARRCLEEGIPLEKDLFQNTKMRGELVELLARKKLFTEAIAELETLVLQSPEDASYRAKLAVVQEQAGARADSDEERKRLQESARANYLWALGMSAPPARLAEVHGQYATFLGRLGLMEDCLSEYRRAIALYPTQKLYQALVKALELTGRQAEAEAARREMNARYPETRAGP